MIPLTHNISELETWTQEPMFKKIPKLIFAQTVWSPGEESEQIQPVSEILSPSHSLGENYREKTY